MEKEGIACLFAKYLQKSWKNVDIKNRLHSTKKRFPDEQFI
jgi:hypothetical protein